MEWTEHATGFSRRAAKRNASFLGVQSTPQCRHPLTKLLPAAVACGDLRPNRPFRWWSIGARFQECLSLSLGAGGLGRFGNSWDVIGQRVNRVPRVESLVNGTKGFFLRSESN